MSDTTVCEHGSLRRQCPHCDVKRLEEELATLRQRYAILNSKYGLCVAGCTQLKGALLQAEAQRNFLLENFIEGEDGKFTFPDGEAMVCKKK